MRREFANHLKENVAALHRLLAEYRELAGFLKDVYKVTYRVPLDPKLPAVPERIEMTGKIKTSARKVEDFPWHKGGQNALDDIFERIQHERSTCDASDKALHLKQTSDHVRTFLGALAAADDADGRHGDPRRRHRPELDKPVQRREHGPIIVERFAHAHKDHVRDAPVAAERRRRALDMPDLLEDLARRQVALEPHAARRTKGAAHAAADLRGDAHRDPAARAALRLVHDRDRLDERAVVESDDELEAGVGFGRDGALDG